VVSIRRDPERDPLSEAPEGLVLAVRTRIRRWRAIGTALMGVIVAGSFLFELQPAVGTTVQLTGSALAQQYAAHLRQFYCLQDEIHGELPRGAAVAVGSGSYDSQVLTELVVLWAKPEPSLQHSGWTLSVVTPGSCEGEGIRAVFHP
jgi:hypothetical protein